MKQIKLRDFQRYLHKILKDGDPCHILSDGQIIGYFEPMSKTNDGRVSGSQNLQGKQVDMTVTHQIIDGHALVATLEEIFSGAEVCFKCNKERSSYEGEAADEYGEWIKMRICEGCYKKFKPPKFKLIK